MITLTPLAVQKIKEISESESINHHNIRLKTIGGGCAGLTRDMFFEETISDLDEIIEQDGIKIIIDPLSLQYLEGVIIDYKDDPISSGFSFNDPNIKGSCGCGKSFAY